jgi:WD40 repeat protein
VLTLTDYGTPRLWDADSGDELLRLQDSTVLWALSPDGTRLVTDSSLWDLKKQMKLAQLPKRVSLSSTLTFNRDGDRIFAEGTYVLNGWTAELMATHDRPANAISIDGYAVQSVSGESGERFTLWDMNSGRIIRDLPFVSRSGWTGAVFSQDGTMLFVFGNLKGSVVDPKTGDELLSIRGVWWHDDPVLSPRGTMVAAKTYRKVLRIFAIAPRTEQIREPEPISCAMFTPEGRRVITASGDKIRIRDIRTLGELLTCKGHRGRVTSVDVSPDGSRIVSASRDTAYVWDATTGAMLAKLNHDGVVWSAKFSPGGRRIVTARTQLWDAVTGTRIRSLEGQSVKFSADGNSVLTLARSTARIWDVESGEALHELRTPLGAQMADFSPDGTRVLFAGVSSVEVWRLRSDRPEEEIRLKHNLLESNFDQALFSPDGRKVIAADNWNTTCFLWDAQSGEVLHRMRHAGHIIRIAFSPDGKLVMTTSTDDTVRVWEVATGSELFRFRGWHGCFSPDGRKVLAYGHGEKTARIWPLNLLPMALKRRPRYLTQRERDEFHAWGPAERGMQRLVERLFEEHVVQTEVIARIEADTALSEEERGLALQMAYEHPPTTPYHLNQAAWAVAKKPGRASEDYQLALRRIETARKSVPDSYHYLNTLGVVQYRLALYENAVNSLLHAESLRAKRGIGAVPEEVAFLAMCYHRLGQMGKASRELDRLRSVMKDVKYASRREARVFLAEAEDVFRER